MRRFFFVLVMLFGAAAVAQAQVVRESDATTIAGVLARDAAGEYVCYYVVTSNGNQLLTADLDAEMFMRPGQGGGEGGGCEEGSGGEGGTGSTGGGSGCDSCGGGETGETGGPRGFYLEVWDSLGTMIHSSGRPVRPGWDRDPRMIYLLAEGGQYTLKVRFVPAGENGPGKVPFLLNVSLRQVATNGNDLKLAGLESRSQFPMGATIR